MANGGEKKTSQLEINTGKSNILIGMNWGVSQNVKRNKNHARYTTHTDTHTHTYNGNGKNSFETKPLKIDKRVKLETNQQRNGEGGRVEGGTHEKVVIKKTFYNIIIISLL